MPTNEERREVARRIRNSDFEALPVEAIPLVLALDTENTSLTVLCTLALIVYGDREVMTGKEIVTGKEVMNRLADFIEPEPEPEPERTCQDFGGEESTNGEQYEFACSACGFFGDVLQPNYCPNCGAKVVGENDNR